MIPFEKGCVLVMLVWSTQQLSLLGTSFSRRI
jgi:hypothetical protein